MTRYLPVAFLCLGCASGAKMIENRGASQYAPTNERPGGRVIYVENGAAWVVRARREDAYRQMYERCSGKYSITTEQDVPAGSVSMATGSSVGSFSGASSTGVGVFVKLIDFECDGPERAGR